MIGNLPPALILLGGALVLPFLANRTLRNAFLLLIALFSLANVMALPREAELWQIAFLDYTLILGRLDRLCLPFGYVFSLVTVIAVIYAFWRPNDELTAGLIYAGGALGVVFAGDWLTLFFFWEIMALAAAYIVWAGRTDSSYQAGMRYLLVHLVGGLILLAGIALHVQETGSLALGRLELEGWSACLILAGFGINAAFPLLHAWLPDAYPEASYAGTVFLSAFTTKAAVYVLARFFAGTELLIFIGGIMAIFPLFYAAIENNLNRVLSYSIINQVGLMVMGVGIGTELAINGTVAHTFSHIFYKALLFMSLGAVCLQTGKIKATDLGGLYRHMPWTAAFCLIGAATSAGFPLSAGFISKAMLTGAAGKEQMELAWLTMLVASAGVFLFSGIKVPYAAFFGRASGLTPREAPLPMLVAMGIAGLLCLGIGIYPAFLYGVLPYAVDYHPYTISHVTGHLQVLFFAALALILLRKAGLYPVEIPGINLDADWFYRRGARAFLAFLDNPMAKMGRALNRTAFETLPRAFFQFSQDPLTSIRIAAAFLFLAASRDDKRRQDLAAIIQEAREDYPHGLKKHWTVAPSATWIVLLLLTYLVIYYVT
jgi:multicomponent Na+:H+ antiporter subunit D